MPRPARVLGPGSQICAAHKRFGPVISIGQASESGARQRRFHLFDGHGGGDDQLIQAVPRHGPKASSFQERGSSARCSGVTSVAEDQSWRQPQGEQIAKDQMTTGNNHAGALSEASALVLPVVEGRR